MPENLEKAVNFLEKLKKENRIKDFAVRFNEPECNLKLKKFISLLKDKKITLLYSEKKEICIVPFTSLTINQEGNVYTCCAEYIKNYSIGNIFENTLEEIWKSEKAEKLRKKIINGDYSLCDTDICAECKMKITVPAQLTYNYIRPKKINLAYDKECNIWCLTCREKKYRNPQKFISLNDEIIKRLISVLKNADSVTVSSAGEAFYSRYSRELIKKLSAENPDIKWCIKTNGLLFNTSNCKKLGIYRKIESVTISLPALDRTIYEKIMRGSDYDTVIKNIKEAAYEYNNNKSIKRIRINSVIHSLNYKEIPKLAEFAKENNLYILFSKYCYWNTEFGKDYKAVSVWDKDHPEYEEFKKIMKHPALNYEKVSMSPIFKKIREP